MAKSSHLSHRDKGLWENDTDFVWQNFDVFCDACPNFSAIRLRHIQINGNAQGAFCQKYITHFRGNNTKINSQITSGYNGSAKNFHNSGDKRIGGRGLEFSRWAAREPEDAATRRDEHFGKRLKVSGSRRAILPDLAQISLTGREGGRQKDKRCTWRAQNAFSFSFAYM